MRYSHSSYGKFCFNFITMSEKDLQLLIDLAEAKLKKGVTKEDALQSFIAAGILDESGDYTAPYKELEGANS